MVRTHALYLYDSLNIDRKYSVPCTDCQMFEGQHAACTAGAGAAAGAMMTPLPRSCL
jgi:hypothetical protein